MVAIGTLTAGPLTAGPLTAETRTAETRPADIGVSGVRPAVGATRSRRTSVLPSKQKRPMNKAWHDCHRMPRTAKLDEKIEWHIAHKQHCGCRDIPATIRRKMIEHGIVEHPIGFNVGRDDHFHPDTNHLAGLHRLAD